MAQYRSSNQCCATCSYWLGDRELKHGNFLEVRSEMDKGKCGALAPTESRTFQACYRCSKYRKWPVLK